MAPIAFVSAFRGANLLATRKQSSLLTRFDNNKRRHSHRSSNYRCATAKLSDMTRNMAKRSAKGTRIIGIVGKRTETEKSVEVESSSQKGLFGMKANAYWDSMGVLPLFFAGFGVVALAIKMLKVKGGEWRSGPTGVNKVTIPKTAITSVEEEAELHVFKCGGCGYEIYPARGREFKFFPDSFKCPLCGTPKSGFWDLNDPDDPRNQEEEEEEEEESVNDAGGNGTSSLKPEDPSPGGSGAEAAKTDRAESDPST